MKHFLFFVSLLLWSKDVSCQIITTVAGNGTNGFAGDGGQALSAELYYPSGIAFDKYGNLYIGDVYNHRVRKVSPAGIITTVAGNSSYGYSGDGGPAISAALYSPYGVALDTAGNLYIADYSSHVVRKVNVAGIISTLAGTGTPGYTGNGGPGTSATLDSPTGVTVGKNGNVFIAEYGNSVIRKVDTAGIITTVAGNNVGGFAGDGGPAVSANIYHPFRVTFDNLGNMYIADKENNRVRKVSTTGIISTFAGNGTPSHTGDGGLAVSAGINTPTSVVFDNMGNLYIGDEYNNVIRKVNAAGIITTFAGTGTYGFAGDGGLASTAQLKNPCGVAFDATGSLYVADEDNHRIRKITLDGPAETSSLINHSGITVYPNPTNDQFFIAARPEDDFVVELYDVNGRHLFSQTSRGKSLISVVGFDEGIYSLSIKLFDRVVNQKLIVLH